MFSRSPLVREVLEESRQEFPRYKKDGTRHKKNWVKRQCQVCDQWVGASHIAVDHIDPVISVEHGKQDWNEFIDRLCCNTSGKANLQRICDPCHDKKTAKERYERMLNEENAFLDIVFGPHCYAKLAHPDILKFAKKFTPKRFEKYPYPEEFKGRIAALKTHLGIKISKPKNKSK